MDSNADGARQLIRSNWRRFYPHLRMPPARPQPVAISAESGQRFIRHLQGDWRLIPRLWGWTKSQL